MNEQKLKAAIAYLGDTIRETDEIMPECSPALQAELTEQRGHYVVAIEAMQSSLPGNKALTCEGCMYFEDDYEFDPCAGCMRLVRKNDYYRRPPEKGDHHEV